MKDVKKILLATDFSSGATAALKQGFRMCERDGTQLELLHVVDSHGMVDLADALHQSVEETTRHFEEDAGTHRGERHEDSGKERYRAPDDACEDQQE